MKNFVKLSLAAAGLFVAVNAGAQTVGHDLKSAGRSIGHAGKTVGHKTAHIAAKGAAASTDKRYEGHYGPGGEDIYINKHSRYFYVNKKGGRVYVSKAHLRTTKPM